MERVAVVGVGAIGGVVAARLLEKGRCDVTLCVRTPFEKLVVETPKRVIEAEAKCATDPARVGPAEWVLLATKAHHTEGAAGWLKALAGPGTVIAVLHNGVEHLERVTPYANGARVLPVVVQCPADKVGLGRMKHRSFVRLVAPDDEYGRGLAKLFEGTDVEVPLTKDIKTELWTKLTVNCAQSPITGLTRRRREVLGRPDVSEVSLALARECAAVGRAEGARLAPGFAEEVIARQKKMPPDATTSMLTDAWEGKPLEMDAFTGAVIRFGEKHGVPTPVTRVVHALGSAVNRED
ncbi:MAG: 2-dehydropantoate 2-reductase [Candidatus Tectomicrobia bacterium]|uniref:2-dehydropantoate 2-reductase n=1 Tax=Tectimicrobiota bacterium TaxID=2528274 RepID=A0A932HZ95_UNCTE|nr:2-dehydropantoate 2-reductase [Candidatus Tectomicrobia bacterium]